MCLRTIVYHVLVIFLMSTVTAGAYPVSFIEEQVYVSRVAESYEATRIIAHELVKQKLLNALGKYIKKETVVRHFQIRQDEIAAVMAGMVRIRIIKERCQGNTCYVKGQIADDMKRLIRAVDILCQDRRRVNELVKVRQRAEEVLRECGVSGGLDHGMKKRQSNECRGLSRTLQSIDWYERGYFFLWSGDDTVAIASFTSAIALDPGFAEAYFHRSVALTRMGDFPQAARDCEEATRLDPDNERAQYHCGYVQSRQGNHYGAIAHYSRVIALNPESEQAFFRRCIARVRVGEYYQALRDCDMALDLILLKECP